jgi:succinate-semialdehyde dehydrogenase / glutarate-semialdehyde dehydrogenase
MSAEPTMSSRHDNGSALVADVPTGLFIDGKWRPASDGETFEVIDPATGKPLTSVASAAVDDGRDAAAAAAAAQPEWAATAPRERGEILRRAFELMTDRKDQLAELMVLENGKALKDAVAEVVYAAEFFRWYAEEAVRLIGSIQEAPAGTNKIVVIHQPVGVALLITPWNFPAAMATRKIGPAFAAGCTVILKPASDTPLTALALASLLTEAGAPQGTINVLPSRRSGPLVSALLADSPVSKLSFTGSTEVGRGLLAQASERILNASMELGGNAPFLVLDDADMDDAVAGAMIAKMRNGGEACTAANRFYVQSPVAEEFSRRLAEAMANLRVGPGLDPGTDLGPLVNQAGKDKVAELVQGALDSGARVLSGAHAIDRPGYFYEPTVLGYVPPDALILDTEIFGPVAPVVAFDSDADAIALANGTDYGLVSYLYTGDYRRGLGIAEALEAGMVGLNRPIVSDPAAPFGGVKRSGIGREGGHDGMLEFTETKYIAVEW